MTTIVTRLFADNQQAEAASAALRKAGFSKQAVGMVGAKSKDALAAISALGVYDAGAKVYADAVSGGLALVVAQAPFGKSYQAMNILEGFDPVPAAVKYTEVYVPAKDPPSRYRKRADLPTLLNSNTLVLSDGIFPPAVIRNHRPFDSILSNYRGKANLIQGTISEKLGLPLLSAKRGQTKLVQSGAVFSKSLGMPVLKGDNQ